ncbi:hypothetical protein PSN45_004528 [Yamadazyma tenuis]|uniref:Alpha/beta-hydrolase n=1 Tax=Candida tenuis (strain ATCC 10573 / BCRC 21748 / CBS 615 / JCM 9827 / NBRC 10315 / NRRL Y-1498 / VKM Y-70) TaxID=590646 RepID=G3B5D7_CANTC|nr:uncharacterized protein CANTEDRAFT_135029 [Yamadazyma tenuis ATCC 10573]EGV63193.1 hypothetical protein CANTEDRAFT_135029 [Yamadazyma tenuis ATCC 10573]WEJ96982.1 hypothetical protein PSN45_004528 [Yamadazyma tenuis]
MNEASSIPESGPSTYAIISTESSTHSDELPGEALGSTGSPPDGSDHSPENESDLDEDDIIDLGGVSNSTSQHPSLARPLSRNDANSFVGGEIIDNEPTKKIFSFQLPFGGTFSSLKSNLYSQVQHRLPNFNIFNNLNGDSEEIKEDIRLKLVRQESLNTLNEANYFKTVRTRDDVRFRAVKHSIANKYNEFIPHISSNAKPMEEYESIYSRIKGNIVILGGYRGSILRDAQTHKRVWIPLKAGFNLRKINLLLGPSLEDEVNASKYIIPDGVLKNIGPIDLCKSFIKRLSNNPNTRVKEFGYDWRLSGEFVSQQLEAFLQKIYDDTGEPTLVICHSMGGLITHRTLHKNPKLFRSIIYVGVPSECLNILGPIRTGESVLFSDRILTAEANFMMRSSFNFLPLSGKVFYNRETHEPYVLDLFNPDTWVEYNLNPLVAKSRLERKSEIFTGQSSLGTGSTLLENSLTSISSRLRSIKVRSLSPLSRSPRSETFDVAEKEASPSPTEDEDGFTVSFDSAYTYLADSLKKAHDFLLDLSYKPELEAKYPPMAIVYGNTVPSVRGSNVSSEQDIKDGNYYDFFYGHGDGVVHQKWLMPERRGFEVYDPTTKKGQIVGRFATSHGHVNLMTDLKAMGEALNAVCEAEKIWTYNETL